MRTKLNRVEARQAEERTDQRRVFLISLVLAAAAMGAAYAGFVIVF